MPELSVDLIVKAISKGFDALMKQVKGSGDAVEQTNKKIDDSSKTTKKSIGDLGKGLNSIVQDITGFNIAQLGAAGALALVAKEVGASIRFTADYAEQIRTLSAATGMNNQETAKMIQLFDDANVDIGLLESASKKLIQNGLSPSIDTIANLADQYNALHDPVAKGKLLLDNFGKAGLDMGKLLEMGGQKIRDAGKEAEKAGQVMSDEALRGAEEYRQALDNLGDSVEGVKIRIGSGLLPVLADAINQINDWTEATAEHTDTFKILDEALADGLITQEEYNSMVVTSAKGTKTFKGSAEQLAEIQGRVKDLYERSIPVISDYAVNMGEVASNTDAANAANALSESVFDAAGKALAASNIPLAEKVKLEEALALASGKVTGAELEREREAQVMIGMLEAGAISQDAYTQAVTDLANGASWAKVQNDLLKEAVQKAGGAASAAQAPVGDLALGMQNVESQARDAKAEVDFLKKSIDGLHSKQITIKVLMQTINTTRNMTGQGFGGQYGLSKVVPPGYPNDTYPVFASSGEKVLIIPNRTVSGLTPPDLTHTLPRTGARGSFAPLSPGMDPGTVFVDGDHYSMSSYEIHNHSREAAAITMSMAMNSRLRRLNDRMG